MPPPAPVVAIFDTTEDITIQLRALLRSEGYQPVVSGELHWPPPVMPPDHKHVVSASRTASTRSCRSAIVESVAHALPTLAEHGSHRWVVTLHFTTINAEETMMFINEAVLRMLARVQTRAHDEDGQGLAEYGLILALIAVVCIIALTALGEGVAAKIGEVTAGLS